MLSNIMFTVPEGTWWSKHRQTMTQQPNMVSNIQTNKSSRLYNPVSHKWQWSHEWHVSCVGVQPNLQ